MSLLSLSSLSPPRSHEGGARERAWINLKKMCQNPKSPNPTLPNRGGEGHHEQRPQRQQQEQDRDRDLRKQALVHELSAKLASGDPSAQIEAARDVRRIARASARARSAFAVAAVVDPLVSMLAAPDRPAKESALLALLNLAVRNERWAPPSNLGLFWIYLWFGGGFGNIYVSLVVDSVIWILWWSVKFWGKNWLFCGCKGIRYTLLVCSWSQKEKLC